MLGVSPPLEGWHDFYVIVGTAAGALTGLQFVVMALSQGQTNPNAVQAMRSYATPTIVHFTTVLALAGLLTIPELTRGQLGAILLTVAVVSLTYTALIIHNDRRQDIYMADLEDQIWHFTLPPLAQASILVAGFSAWSSPKRSLYLV